MLTKAEKQRAANEARFLAMSILNGTAPKFGRFKAFNGDKPVCAAGWVRHLAGIPDKPFFVSADTGLRYPAGKAVGEAAASVAYANDWKRSRDALVFPLLNLADVLEGK